MVGSKTQFIWCLRGAAAIVVSASAMHMLLGLQADLLLGASVSASTRLDPSLDSQNRFYGGCFLLYAVLLYLASKDLSKYATMLRCLLWVFLLAGLVRFISVYLYGWPAVLINLLFAAELLVPPILLGWLQHLSRHGKLSATN